ncbi:hypothetical protein CVT24_002503, partial [Panaeolus cyanescens]
DRVDYWNTAPGTSAETRREELDEILGWGDVSPHTVTAIVDASVPPSWQHQATVAAVYYRNGAEFHHSRSVAGKALAPDAELFAIRCAISYASLQEGCTHIAVTVAAVYYRNGAEFHHSRSVAGKALAPDAELFAIRCAISYASLQEGCTHIAVFTDSLAMARRAVQPEVGQGQHQATVAAVYYRNGAEFHHSRSVAGKALAPDAELFAIRCAISYASLQEGCTHIAVFTDSLAMARRAVQPEVGQGQVHALAICRLLAECLAMARRAVQPEVGQGQVHALAICRLLTEWFAKGNNHRVSFVYVPSGIHWHPHDKAHRLVCKLTVPIGRRMATTLSWLRREADTKCEQAWINSFRLPKVQGHNYLALQSHKRADVTPSAVKGGPWITR